MARHAEAIAGQPAVQSWNPGHSGRAAVTLFQSFWLQLGWMAVPGELWIYNVLADLRSHSHGGGGRTIDIEFYCYVMLSHSGRKIYASREGRK